VFLVFAAIVIAAAITGMSIIFHFEQKERPPVEADVVIVLGARVMPDGELSTTLEFRIQTAYEVFRQGYADYFIVCGAQGRDEPMTEAQAMKNFLVERDVPSENIFMEDQSFNTVQNLAHAREIMEEQGFETALIVTSNYHIERAMRLTADAGIQATGVSAPGPLYLHNRLKARLRESGAWAKYLVVGMVGK